MHRLMLCLVFVCAIASAQPKPAASTRMTGCLDERRGPQYVLRDPQNLNLIAVLEPVGFPVQGFAKHLGHTVQLTGSRVERDGATILQVRSIRTLSETCGRKEQNSRAANKSKLSALSALPAARS